MKITNLIIQDSFEYNDFDDKTKMFTLGIFMHKYGVINDEKLKAIFRNAATNPNNRKGTYHCKIIDKWYHDEKYIDILKEAWYKHPNNPGSIYEIEMEELIKYVNRFLNKPRNYCIDWIRSHYIDKIVNGMSEWNIHRLSDYIESYGFDLRGIYYDEWNYEPSTPTGWCCEDCDGPWENFKASAFRNHVVNGTKDHVMKVSTEHLDTFKKKYPMLEFLQK